MTRSDVFKTKFIAKMRIYVGRALMRLKYFSILVHRMPISLLNIVDDVVTVCAALTNLRAPLV